MSIEQYIAPDYNNVYDRLKEHTLDFNNLKKRFESNKPILVIFQDEYIWVQTHDLNLNSFIFWILLYVTYHLLKVVIV